MIRIEAGSGGGGAGSGEARGRRGSEIGRDGAAAFASETDASTWHDDSAGEGGAGQFVRLVLAAEAEEAETEAGEREALRRRTEEAQALLERVVSGVEEARRRQEDALVARLREGGANEALLEEQRRLQRALERLERALQEAQREQTLARDRYLHAEARAARASDRLAELARDLDLTRLDLDQALRKIDKVTSHLYLFCPLALLAADVPRSCRRRSSTRRLSSRCAAGASRPRKQAPRATWRRPPAAWQWVQAVVAARSRASW